MLGPTWLSNTPTGVGILMERSVDLAIPCQPFEADLFEAAPPYSS